MNGSTRAGLRSSTYIALPVRATRDLTRRYAENNRPAAPPAGGHSRATQEMRP